MSELPKSITEAAAWLRDGRITSIELTKSLLARTYATQDTIGAFITITEESALAAAKQADADLAAGIDRGPLQGIPLAVKDIITTADAPTTANSNVLDRAWGERGDAPVVRRLRDAGAVITGKLGLSEFAIGWPDPATGFRVTKNPWDLERSPGGSSSGTGAAIAAGLILGGLGTDTGGSIRGPASYCGISGIKQTFGLVSKDGCVPLGYSLDNIGPMAWTAHDCAIMLQVLAGYDPADPCTVDVPVPDMTAGLTGSFEGVRIGIPRDYFFTVPQLDAEVKAAVLAAIDAMAAAGATVVDVSIPHAAEGRAAQFVTMLAEAYAYHEPDLQTKPELYGKYTRETIRRGAFFSSADYVQAQRVRALVKAEAAAALADVDVLITPTMISPAPAFVGWDPAVMLTNPSFTGIWNLTGFPALSIPCGFTSELGALSRPQTPTTGAPPPIPPAGLPIGMQIVGRPFDEPTVLKVGDAYQQLTDWHTRRPAISAIKEAAAV
jgi:aspartyl-tRNA(Asn)/glutamyl-tRNA(Gln) amidotransferase subunit A